MVQLAPDRPGHIQDDDWRPMSEDQDQDHEPAALEGGDLNYHSERKKSHDSTDLARKEEDGAGQDSPEDDSESGFFKDKSGDKKKKFRISRKQGTAGGIIAGMIISVVMAVATQGPAVAITHVRDMLISRVGQVQMYQGRKYRQGKLNRLKNLFSKDARMGQKIIDEMEARGYIYRFDPNDKTKIIGLTLPDGSEGKIGDGVGDEIDQFMEERHPFRSARWKTKRMDAFYKKFGVTRSSPIDGAKLTGDDADPETVVNKEMANDVVAGEPQEFESEKLTDADDADDATKAENAKKNEIGASTDGASGEIGENYTEIQQDLLDGKDIGEIDNPLAASLDAVEDGASPEILDTVTQLSKGTLGGKAWSAVKGFLNPLDIADKLCTLRNRIRQAQTVGRATRSLKLLRYAGTFIKAGDDVRRGKADMSLAGKLMKRIMSDDANGNSFGSSSGFKILSNGKFSKSQNEASRNKIGVDGKLTGIAGGIKEATDKVPGMSACWAWQNPAFQVAAGAADVVVTAVSCVFTGCAAAAGKKVVQEAAEQGIKTVITNTIKKIITKKLVAELAVGFAIDFGIDQAMTYLQMYAQKTLLLSFSGQEKGGQLADILVAGSGTLNKNRSASAGMVPATTAQYAQTVQQYYAWRTEDRAKQSMYSRVFDASNPDSLAFSGLTAAMGVQSNGTVNNVTNLASSATSLLTGGFMSNALSLFSGSAKAEGDDIEYDEYTLDGGSFGGTSLATDLAGNPQYIMRSDIESIDPETNAESLANSGAIDSSTLEPKSDAFLKYIDDCVDNPDTFSKLEFESADCLATKTETKEFAAHLAFVDMTDGLQAEFDPGSLDTSTGGTTGGGGSTPPANVTDKNQDTSGMACAPLGLTGERVEPIGDGTVKIKLCDYGGVKGINASWSPSVSAMVEAAGSEGIVFTSGGFRTAAEQIRLRGVNGCPDTYTAPASSCRVPTAIPGTSNHEKGLAMDHADMCFPAKTCVGNQRYDWLINNAGRWQIIKLSSEAWHWSVDGR